jgi:phosphoserine phosphatase
LLRFLRLFHQFRALEAERDYAQSAQRGAQTCLQEMSDQAAACRAEMQALTAERDELRAALQEQNTQCLLLQDRLDAAQESVSRLWGMVETAQNRAYRAMESQVNFSTQMKFGVTPYPEASHLPPSLEPDLDSDSVVPRRRMPSEMVADARRNLVTELHQRLTKKPASA